MILFKAPEALGWACQYWTSEETRRERIFEKIRTQKGTRIHNTHGP